MAYHREPGEGARARLVAKRGTAWVARSRLSAFSNLRSFGSSVRPSRDARHLGSRGAPRCSRPGHGLPCSRLRLVNALRPWTSTATPQLRNPTGTKCRTILFFRQGPIYLRDQPENQRDHLLFTYHIVSSKFKFCDRYWWLITGFLCIFWLVVCVIRRWEQYILKCGTKRTRNLEDMQFSEYKLRTCVVANIWR